jgi:hypothetical protein
MANFLERVACRIEREVNRNVLTIIVGDSEIMVWTAVNVRGNEVILEPSYFVPLFKIILNV